MASTRFQRRLKRLYLDWVPVKALANMNLRNPPHSSLRNDASIDFVSVLEVEDLHIGLAMDAREGRKHPEELRHFLSSMPHLKNLDLSWDRYDYADTHLNDECYRFLDGMPWVTLESLRLRGVYTTADSLRALSLEHSKSLRHLSQCSCRYT
jgi:hypothetical protein